MPLPESNNHFTLDLDKYNIAESQDKDWTIAIRNKFKDFKNRCEYSLKTENTNSWMK